jgi:hypothetical protein
VTPVLGQVAGRSQASGILTGGISIIKGHKHLTLVTKGHPYGIHRTSSIPTRCLSKFVLSELADHKLSCRWMPLAWMQEH